jgi:hypothetical protein
VTREKKKEKEMLPRSIAPFMWAVAMLLVFGIAVSDFALPNAMAQDGLFAKSPDIVLQDLRARKVKPISGSQLRKQISQLKDRGGMAAHKCGQNACMCVGAKSCGDLVASKQCSDDFHCLKTNDGPACVCSQK